MRCAELVGFFTAFHKLLQAIRGEAMGGPVFEELGEAVHPYLGLHAFREFGGNFQTQYNGRKEFNGRGNRHIAKAIRYLREGG